MRPDIGVLYLHTPTNASKLGSRRNIYHYLGGFVQQPLEISVTDESSGLKVYREVMINPPEAVSGCEDYPDHTPQRFTCVYLRELLPPQAVDGSPDVEALRTTLPNLVQDHDNYELVVAQEFNGSAPAASGSECSNGLLTLSEEVWNIFDACSRLDPAGVPCINVVDGGIYVATSGRPSNCRPNLRTFGNLHFKYGYVEIKYTINLPAHGDYHNLNVVSFPGDKMQVLWDQYGVVIENYEDFLRHSEVEIDYVEFSGATPAIVMHQYANWGFHVKDPDVGPIKSTKVILLCNDKSHSLLPAYACEDSEGNPRDFDVTITVGIEWTPRGYVTHIKADEHLETLTPVPKEKVVLSEIVVNEQQGQYVTGRFRDLLKWERVDYFETFDPDDPDAVLEQAAVAHMPLPIGMGGFGTYLFDGRVIQSKLNIDYIRVWQPRNRYSDMEPVYQ